MSIIGSIVIAKPVYMAAAARKVFELSRVSSMVAGKLPADNAAAVLPSYISMDKAAASAAMGGRFSEASFITGLLYKLAAFAQGQRVEKLVEGLPDFAAHAVKHGASLLRLGAGVNSEMLRHATMAGIESMLALPARPAAEKKTSPTTPGAVINGTAQRVPNEQPAAPVQSAGPDLAAALVAKAETEHATAWAAYGDSLAAGIKAGKASAAVPDFVALFATLAAAHADQAAAMLPAMAAAAGLVVVTAQHEAEQAAELAALKAELAALKAKPARTKKAA